MLSASEPITHERELELAWAAGFFDGEGHVKFQRSSSGAALAVQVGQVHRATLERFQAAAGGEGAIRFAPKSTGREYWVLEVYGRDSTLRVFRLLAPYLSAVKTEQFLAAFRSYNDRPRQRRIRHVEQIVGLE